ncbi:MAG TPA: LuxR C-terminal-related transcriptional regulator [Pseudonocardiaceae bacterium]|nr:LuxR C-terminal-related transcriptional regulator [Pseudonocardiaceae bacterium]
MLQVLGLAPDEQDLYEQLVSCPPLTMAQVCELVECRCAGGDCATPAALDRLRGLGLVSRQSGEPPRWSATPPNAALQVLISERDRELAETRRYLAEVTSRFSQNHTVGNPPAMVEVIYGREEIIRRGIELQRGTRREIRACDAPPYPADDAAAVNTMELDHLRRGVRYRILYDRRALDIPGRLADLEAGIAAGEQARVTDIPLKMTLSDYPMAILPLRSPPDVESRLIVHDCVLLDALSALFEMYWDQALPLRVSAGRAELPGHEGGPSADERHLLPLLVAGLTDQEIAAQLGVSDRTVRSRVRAMMARLDAATRFQAGYQAVQRGWLAVDDAVDDRVTVDDPDGGPDA